MELERMEEVMEAFAETEFRDPGKRLKELVDRWEANGNAQILIWHQNVQKDAFQAFAECLKELSYKPKLWLGRFDVEVEEGQLFPMLESEWAI